MFMQLWDLLPNFLDEWVDRRSVGMFLQNIGRIFEATMVTISENGMFLIPSVLIRPKMFGLSGLIWWRPVASAIALCFSLVIGIRAWRIYINTPSHINSNIQEA